MEIFLNNYGSTLHVENGRLVVLNSDGKHYIDPAKVKMIQLSKGSRITSDAVLLAIEHEIDIIFSDKNGIPEGRIWSVRYGSISTIRRNQSEFVYSKQAIEWIKDILIQKIHNQIALLYTIASRDLLDEQWLKEHSFFQKSINNLKDYASKIRAIEGECISDVSASLRGWEGISSKKYFDTLSKLLPANYSFEERSQHPARDAFNSLLNYGYGMLYSKIEGALIKAGIDPYLGVFHRENYNRPVLVFDVIELYRHWIDYVVVDLCFQQIVNDDWFMITNDGIYWLESLGKRILIQSVNDYFNEVIDINQIQRSRNEHIQIYAHHLANMFQAFK